MKKRYLAIALVILSLISLFIGVSNISIKDILAGDSSKMQIILISRVPRLISIVIAGMGLSISGLIMQQISRNKFTSPTTAGTMDSAKMGLMFAMLFMPKAGVISKAVFSFIFALLGSLIFMTILKKLKVKNIIFAPLVGMMFGNLVSSITSFISYYKDMNQSLNAWFQGSFSTVMKGNYELLYLCIPAIILAFIYANKFTIVGMGEDFAINLGVNYNFVVNVGLAIVSLICAVTIITVGNIPFLGLIIPNIISLYSGDNLKKTLYHTALLGPIFLLACDILGRFIIFPFEMSISLTVGVIGSIIFLYMIIRGSKNEG